MAMHNEVARMRADFK